MQFLVTSSTVEQLLKTGVLALLVIFAFCFAFKIFHSKEPFKQFSIDKNIKMVQPQPHHNNYEEHEGVANPRAEYLTEYQPSAYQTSKDHHENNICGLPRGINSHHDTVLNHHEKQLIISQFWDKFHQNIVEQARKKQ